MTGLNFRNPSISVSLTFPIVAEWQILLINWESLPGYPVETYNLLISEETFFLSTYALLKFSFLLIRIFFKKF